MKTNDLFIYQELDNFFDQGIDALQHHQEVLLGISPPMNAMIESCLYPNLSCVIKS